MLTTVCVVLSWVCVALLLGYALWLLVRSPEKSLLVAYLAVVLGMAFEMWMSQHWLGMAKAWQDAYWRDIGTPQKQLRQSG